CAARARKRSYATSARTTPRSIAASSRTNTRTPRSASRRRSTSKIDASTDIAARGGRSERTNRRRTSAIVKRSGITRRTSSSANREISMWEDDDEPKPDPDYSQKVKLALQAIDDAFGRLPI